MKTPDSHVTRCKLAPVCPPVDSCSYYATNTSCEIVAGAGRIGGRREVLFSRGMLKLNRIDKSQYECEEGEEGERNESTSKLAQSYKEERENGGMEILNCLTS